MKCALISCTIHPRTYKVPQDFSVCIGNIARIDVASVECLGDNENINLEQVMNIINLAYKKSDNLGFLRTPNTPILLPYTFSAVLYRGSCIPRKT